MTSAPIPSQNAVTGSSGTHPVPEGAADNAPPANSGVQCGEVDFEYTNWEGRKSLRRARPISIRFGKSEWHPKPQWLMRAFDIDKGEDREFAMVDMEFEDSGLAALALSSTNQGGAIAVGLIGPPLLPFFVFLHILEFMRENKSTTSLSKGEL